MVCRREPGTVASGKVVWVVAGEIFRWPGGVEG